MKLEFDDKGYNFISIKKVNDSGMIAIILSSKDSGNPNKTIVNSAEITYEQFKKLISDLELSS